MKGFLSWFKGSTKIKRWIFLILIGVVLVCLGLSKMLVGKELSVIDVISIVVMFVARFYMCYIRYCLHTKKNT